MPTIAVINESSMVGDADLALWVSAIQHQVLEDVAPWWPLAASANLLLVPRGVAPPTATWQLVVLDDADSPNALGYHQTTFFGLPLGKVFARTTAGFGQTISRVVSHEIIEMIADPDVRTKVTIGGQIYLAEACDPVHLDQCGYKKQGVLVSNFVTPRYYGLSAPVDDPRNDFCAQLAGPCPSLNRGGALTVLQNGNLTIIAAPDTTPDEMEALNRRPGSRRHRHEIGHANWERSIWQYSGLA